MSQLCVPYVVSLAPHFHIYALFEGLTLSQVINSSKNISNKIGCFSGLSDYVFGDTNVYICNSCNRMLFIISK